MDPLFRTVAIAAASLGLLVSLFFALRPSGDDEAAPATSSQLTTTASAAPTPPPATTAPAQAASDVVKIEIVVRSESTGIFRRLSVKRGRKVELVVTSELADAVHLHGYDLKGDVAPGKPATIRFTADAPGRFEIELEGRGLMLAELEVRP